ncbi:MAG: hypothetical protein GX800_00985 [Clostridiaceae bacterium]|jgi:hypothetical protein|nr:hypothetical protein [Clostridiaceae bacterium]
MQIKNTSINDLYPVIAQLLENQDVKLIIKGNSMYPLLRSNVDSVVLTKKNKIKKYDVLFYKRENGEYIIHRLIGKKDNAFSMAGDFETELEYPIYEHQVIAVIRSFYRGKKHISCSNLLYKAYSFLWVMLFPNRSLIIAAIKKARYALQNKRWKLL